MGNLGGIDSLSVYPDNPMLKDTSSVYISYYSPNCDFEIGLTCEVHTVSDTTSFLLVKTADAECYKEKDPKRAEQSIENLRMEIQDKVISRLNKSGE